MTEENLGIEGQVIMPFYIICDISGSMTSDMAALNTGLADLRDEIMKDPVVDDLVMMSVITFHSTAQTVVPLNFPTAVTLPRLSATGGTVYGNAFREFHRAFEADRARLKAEGKRVFRPCVFFLSDGEPGDSDYLSVFSSLLGYDPVTKQGNRAYPYVTPFGFRDARERTMAAIAYPNFGERPGRYFLAKQGHNVGELIKAMTGVIAQSVIQSGMTVPGGAPQYTPPSPNAVQGMVGSFVD